jgi:hypothetical protein
LQNIPKPYTPSLPLHAVLSRCFHPPSLDEIVRWTGCIHLIAVVAFIHSLDNEFEIRVQPVSIFCNDK